MNTNTNMHQAAVRVRAREIEEAFRLHAPQHTELVLSYIRSVKKTITPMDFWAGLKLLVSDEVVRRVITYLKFVRPSAGIKETRNLDDTDKDKNNDMRKRVHKFLSEDLPTAEAQLKLFNELKTAFEQTGEELLRLDLAVCELQRQVKSLMTRGHETIIYQQQQQQPNKKRKHLQQLDDTDVARDTDEGKECDSPPMLDDLRSSSYNPSFPSVE